MRAPHKSVLLLLACLFLPGLPEAAEQDGEPLRITHGPYLQNPSEDGMTVIWFTNKPCVSRVEFGSGENLDSLARTSRHGLFEAYTTRHSIRIKGLEPGRLYSYRAESREFLRFDPYDVQFGDTVASGTHGFSTLDPEKPRFSFLVFNDVHENAAVLDERLAAVDWTGVELVFLNGDIVDSFQDENQIFGGFLDVCVERFAREIPFIWIRGNHETRGRMARRLPDYVDLPAGRFYHRLRHGPVNLLVLDSGEDKPDDHEVYAGLVDFDAYREGQAAWLAREIKTRAFKSTAFKIAFSHIPPFGGNDWHGEQDVRRKWGPLLDRAGIDLLICAHTHRFSLIEPQEGLQSFPLLVSGRNDLIRADVSRRTIRLTVFDAAGEVRHAMNLR